MSYKTTIADIAKELNTTAATVSRALRNNPRISEETKRSVQQAANRLNYHRNKIASSLRLGKTHLIGVIIPSAEINFFGSVVHGIESLANANGYNVLLYQSNESMEHERKGIETFLSAHVDGILVSLAKGSTSCSHFDAIKRRKVPLVFFDRTESCYDTDAVLVDDYKGAYLATRHLVDKGYKKIAHIAGPKHLHNFCERKRGFRDALKESGLWRGESYMWHGSVSIESGREGVAHLLSLPDPPDAFFATEDFTALGVMKELKERNISIPDEIGVIGFANEQFGEHISPTLSTVDQQTIQMGKTAFELLMEVIENRGKKKKVSKKIKLEPRLIERGSTDRK